jgi:glucosamine kinase
MKKILAIDAGGTGSRALVLDETGRCLGYGRAGGGNPTSAGLDNAVAAIASAVGLAMEGIARQPVASSAVIALAGEDTQRFRAALSERLAPFGFPDVVVAPDLLGMFHSGSYASAGYSLIAGTGAVAARIAEGKVERLAGGTGWLLGDAGSGFWIGHLAARAVVADLDGQGPETALTPLLLGELGLTAPSGPVGEPARDSGRPRILRQLIGTLYAIRPVELSRFAPLVFRAHEDAVALRILVEASAKLASLLDLVRVPQIDGPIVVGGSVLLEGMLSAPPELAAKLVPLAAGEVLFPVPDGVVGAAVIALDRAGTTVDEELFQRIRSGLAVLRDSHRHNGSNRQDGAVTPETRDGS